MEEENSLLPAEKRKSDEAELNENGSNFTKKICRDAKEESLAKSESDVAMLSTSDSIADMEKDSAISCTSKNDLDINPDRETGEEDSTDKTLITNTDLTISDTVTKLSESKSVDGSKSTPLSEVNVNIVNKETEIMTTDMKEHNPEVMDIMPPHMDKTEGKSILNTPVQKEVGKTEDKSSLSTHVQKVVDCSESEISSKKINSPPPIGDDETDHSMMTNDLTLSKEQGMTIPDSIMSSRKSDENLVKCQISSDVTPEIENITKEDATIGIKTSEKLQQEKLIVEDHSALLLDATVPRALSVADNLISIIKNSDNDKLKDINNLNSIDVNNEIVNDMHNAVSTDINNVASHDINNSTSINNIPDKSSILQDSIPASCENLPIISETSAENDSLLNTDTIPVPTNVDVPAISFSSALKETSATAIHDDKIADTPLIDNSVCDIQVKDNVPENVQGSLLLSENAQSPSFVGSKEASEHEAIKDTVIKIPTLAESLKQAVSADSPGNDTFATQVPINNSEMLDAIKKNEPSPMEVDTPSESLIDDTPCESGETTPSTSTPADSCQVSAAPSPLTKDDSTAIIPDIEDECSKDNKLQDDETLDIKGEEIEEMIPHKRPNKRTSKAKKMATRSTKQKGPLVLDEDTRMSASGNDKSLLIEFPPDEDSQSSVSTSLPSSKKKVRSFRSEVIVPESTEVFTADKVVEYIWPMDGNGEHYFIQEHVAQYLGVTSFKRKYRDLRRRQIESTEKEYLKDMGLVSEMACDLGLTAVRSEDMLDILFNDFPSKYEELQKFWRERDEKNLLKEKGKVDYQVANLDKSKMQEYSRKAALNAAKWNTVFMREKREERRYSFDLQTFTVHYPMKTSKPTPQEPKIGSYPIAVLPGQYTDYCRSYSSKELKSMPLQTVLTGPYTAEELATEALSAESDEESAPASVCTSVDIKEELPPVVELESVPAALPATIDPLSAEKQPRCKACNGGRDRNKEGKPEPLVICGTCRIASHPTCIDLPLAMIEKIEMYSWQCMECKTCAQCNDPDDEEKMIFCDMCDRGYHIYCVGLRKVPNGRWHCKECAICSSCGCKTPSGNEHIKNAEWQHEFKKDKDKQLKYICTLCVPCDKYWKRRQYCTVCLKVYRSIPDDGMVRCAGCPKYIHKDGCSLLVDNERHCTICYSSRNKTALNHSRIIAAAKKKMASSY